ncbi:MAG: hypothetical protein FWC93_00990 [Defluviitaleaceae bacterium]|nr:hypothetical protein [Defluviitaleaceae bacterium]
MKKGMDIFGRQYEMTYRNDTHADGSVDKMLFEQMVKLDDSTVGYLYDLYTDLSNRYVRGSRATLENIVDGIKGETDYDTVNNIVLFCRKIVESCNISCKDMIFGGTEEEIIERGTYWCTNIARVACVLFQIAGLPSRMLITANTKFPYCGHNVAEVYYNQKWGVVDPNAGIVYKHEDGAPASAWEMHKNSEIANRVVFQEYPHTKNDGNSIFFSPGEQYESVGISNYYVDEKEKYSYETSRLNDFVGKIVEHSGRKWAGGLRWIHGEDL